MSFLNATLLLGSLAVLIPVVLHLLGKREPQRVAFPAVRFLTQRLQTNRRRMQVKRWVLLALRILLLVLLALALAQPHVDRARVGDWLAVGAAGILACITLALFLWALVAQRAAWLKWGLLFASLVLFALSVGWGARTLAGGPPVVSSTTAPAAVVFLVDNSPTSGLGHRSADVPQEVEQPLRTEASDGRLGRAQEGALWLLSRYPIESRFALIDRSSRPAAFALDPTSVQRGLKSIRPLQSTRPLAERIDAAVRLLRTSDLPRRSLYVFTDLSRASWDTQAGEQNWQALTTDLAQEPRISLHIIDIGDEQYQNRRLDELELSDITPPKDVPVSISALVSSVRSATSSSESNNGAALDADDTPGQNERSAKELTVQVRLFQQQAGYPLERDGKLEYPRLKTVDRKVVRIKSAGERVSLNLPPLDYGTHHGLIEVLPADELPIDDVRYFSVKVEPPAKILIVCDDAPERKVLAAMLNPFGDDDARREYIIDFATDRTLNDTNLTNYKAIGLINPRLPAPVIRSELEAWVKGGGNLFVTIGHRLDQAGTGEPVDWDLIGRPQRIWRIPDQGTFSQIAQPSHPSLMALASVQGGAPWSAFRIYNYWQLENQAAFVELLRYAGTEHLALGEQRLGAGRVMLLTTPLPALQPPADQWNDLLSSTLSGAWDVYLILLRQVFEDLTGGLGEPLNFMLGEPVVLTRAGEDATSYQLFAPGQPPVQVDTADQTIVPGVPTVAGNYWLRTVGAPPLGFSANLVSGATELERVPVEVLDEVFGQEQYQLVRDKTEIELADGESSQARSIYPFAMLLIAAVFILEQLLANRFYPAGDAGRGMRSGKGVAASGKDAVAAA